MVVPTQKPHRSKQDYCTPVAFIEAAKRKLGIPAFSFDFAADHINTKASKFWTAKDNSLDPKRDWAGVCRGAGAAWGWLNPPFGEIGPWAWRCQDTAAHGGHVAFLTPASVGANWFRDYIDGRAYVLCLNGRLAFMPDKPTWLYPKDCILSLFGPDVVPGYEVWTWKDHQ